MIRILILGANGQLARNTTKFFLECTDACLLQVIKSNPAARAAVPQ